MQDETMSQDVAFTSENNGDNKGNDGIFKFDEVKETSPGSQPNEEKVEDAPKESESSTEEDEQKVPYSRFKTVSDKVKYLEEELENLKLSREEKEEISISDVKPDDAWTELYGDSEAAKKAWIVQQKMNAEIAERAIQEAIQRVKMLDAEEEQSLVQNEEIIDENLDNLKQTIGKKLSSKDEEEILSIVDEFSPIGDDGKYVQLFPFDKAYEIWELRNAPKIRKTSEERENIANLSGDRSDGDIESDSGTFRKGWDSWRMGL